MGFCGDWKEKKMVLFRKHKSNSECTWPGLEIRIFFNALCTFAYGVKMKKTVFGARYQILVSLVPHLNVEVVSVYPSLGGRVRIEYLTTAIAT